VPPGRRADHELLRLDPARHRERRLPVRTARRPVRHARRGAGHGAADLDTQIAYWRAFLEQAKADGQYNPVDVAAIRPGDAIKAHGRWERVVKVNKATITVAVAPGWANKVKINEITEHRPATTPVALESE
jgi:preprotein translocase subunit YajC